MYLVTLRKTVFGLMVIATSALFLSFVACAGQVETSGKSTPQAGTALVVSVTADKGKITGITVTGSGFSPGETVEIKLIGKFEVEWALGENSKVDKSGAFVVKMEPALIRGLSTILEKDVKVYTVFAIDSKGSRASAQLVVP